ncbi:nucleotide-diphospho-sugar transferase [Melampsora americana]|nr:nucleotide-diphospho-sugar transferase [Melampsora americana]
MSDYDSIHKRYTDAVNQIYKVSTQTDLKEITNDEDLEAPPKDSIDSIISIESQSKRLGWKEIGLKAIKQGEVAVLLLAGGQGTRLGSSDPKGCYDIGLPSQKSLFQLQAEKISRLQTLAGQHSIIPWYVMTSGPTRKATEDYFRKSSFFGLDETNVIFFEQGVLPALTNDGKMFLESPSRDYTLDFDRKAHCSSGVSVIEDMTKRGIKYIHAYCVDNCLVKVADPIFLGYSISKNTPCGAKVVVKSNPDESVGILALKKKRWSVVEYSEMSATMASSRAENGELKFKSANIANHFYTLDFLKSIESFESQMAYHVANKKIPHIDLNSKELVKPSKPNGIKLELFIFDVFPFASSLSLLEVARQEEFSPLKNAPGTGSDDPESSRRDLLSQQKRWLIEAGARFDSEEIEVEISPLISYSGEGLEVVSGKVINQSKQINHESDLKNL